MATDIEPFQMHLMFKLQSGKSLTQNELQKAEEMGIEIPFFSSEDEHFDTHEDEGNGEGELLPQSQKWIQSLPRKNPFPGPWYDPWCTTKRVSRIMPHTRRNPEPFFPKNSKIETNPDGETDELDGTPIQPINKSQVELPYWARATERYPDGTPKPRWPIDQNTPGRLDNRYDPFQYQRWRLATTTGKYQQPQYRPPPWARATERDEYGNPKPRNYDAYKDTRLDTRYPPTQYWRMAMPGTMPTNRYQQPQYQPPSWARATERDEHGRPKPRYFDDSMDGRLDTRYGPFDYNQRRRLVNQEVGEATSTDIAPSQIYSWPGSGVSLRIGTGGSDETGLLPKLAAAYLQYCVEVKKQQVFTIAFYATDSGVTMDYLGENRIDVGITDTILLDTLSTNLGVIDRRELGWRDHWMLVGPPDNPAKVPDSTWVYKLFSVLYNNLHSDHKSSTVFLSRADGSASHVKELFIWTAIGRTPSAFADASWYASSQSSASETLAEAASIKAYTLTDSGTWYTATKETRDALKIYAVGSDDDKDILLKRAELVVGKNGTFKAQANQFVDWIISDGGQKVIGGFTSDETAVFSTAAGSKGTVTTNPDGTTSGSGSSKPVNGTNDKPKEPDTKTNGSDTKTTDPGSKTNGSTTNTVPAVVENQPVKKERVYRATAVVPWSLNEYYFFEKDIYVRLDIVKNTFDIKPRSTSEQWPGVNSFPDWIDAILPVDKEQKQAWFFSGDLCAILDIATGKRVNDMKAEPWSKHFPGLKEKGLQTIDCVMPHFWSNAPRCITFFSGNKQIVYNQDDKTVTDLQPSTLISSLGWTYLDTMIYQPNTDFNQMCFFSGDEWVLYDNKTSKVTHRGRTASEYLGLGTAKMFQ